MSVTSWSTDPFTGGGYTHVPPGASPDDADLLGQPVGERLLFAGEHTQSERLGYADGAMSSGLREAARLLGREASATPGTRRGVISVAGSQRSMVTQPTASTQSSVSTRPSHPRSARRHSTSRLGSPSTKQCRAGLGRRRRSLLLRRGAGDALGEGPVLPGSVAAAHGSMVAHVFEPSGTSPTTPFG